MCTPVTVDKVIPVFVTIVIFPHNNSVYVHMKYAFNIAAWFYAQFSDIASPHVFDKQLDRIKHTRST